MDAIEMQKPVRQMSAGRAAPQQLADVAEDLVERAYDDARRSARVASGVMAAVLAVLGAGLGLAALSAALDNAGSSVSLGVSAALGVAGVLLGGFALVLGRNFLALRPPPSLRATSTAPTPRASSSTGAPGPRAEMARGPTLVAALALLAGCGEAPPPSRPPGGVPQRSVVAAAAPSRVLAIGSNYISGTAWSVAPDGTSRPMPLGATGDTVVRSLGEVIAVLNRDPSQADNLTLLEERAGAMVLVSQIDLRMPAERDAYRTANPHDVIALDARTLLVARYNVPSLAVVDVARAEVVRTVDLAPYRGAARLPNPEALYRVGDRIYVTLQRLDDVINPTQPGMLVQLDARTLAVTATLELPLVNPIGAMVPVREGVVRVAMIGSYAVVGDGGVLELDLRGEVPAAEVIVRDADLPAEVRGNIDGLAVIDDDAMVLKVVGERRPGRDIDVLRVLRYGRRARTARVLVQRGVWSGAAPVVLGDTVYVGDPGEGAGHAGAGVRRYTLAGDARGAAATAVGVEMFPYDLHAAP